MGAEKALSAVGVWNSTARRGKKEEEAHIDRLRNLYIAAQVEKLLGHEDYNGEGN